MFKLKKIIFIFTIFVSFSFIIPARFGIEDNSIKFSHVFAQEDSGTGRDTSEDSGSSAVNASYGNNPIQLTNPLGNNIKDIPSLVEQLLEIAMKIGVPLVALMIIYTGYLFIAAQGNPEKLKKAKDSLVWVFIGAAILLGAYVIARSLVGTINAIRGV